MTASRLSGSAALLTVAAIALFQSGCARSVTPLADVASPDESALLIQLPAPVTRDEGIYPLTLGNRWGYRTTLSVRAEDTNRVPAEAFERTWRMVHRLDCVTSFDGRDYVAESRTPVEGVGAPSAHWILYRQDGDGLYEADAVYFQPPCLDDAAVTAPAPSGADGSATVDRQLATIADPVTRAAALAAWQRVDERMAVVREALGLPSGFTARPQRASGLQPGEITRLAYPLVVGRRWLIRDDPGFALPAVVVARELLELPIGRRPAWRIRILWPGSEDELFVTVWYGSSGFLKLTVLASVAMTDETGAIIGTFRYEERQVCDEIQIAGENRLAAAGGLR